MVIWVVVYILCRVLGCEEEFGAAAGIWTRDRRLGGPESYECIHISWYESGAEMIINTHSHKYYYLMADMKGYGVYLFAASVYFISPT